MAAKPIPDGYRSLTPYLVAADAAGAIDFYKTAFGARERMRLPAPGGKIGHAELVIGDSVVMIADEHPEMGAKGPRAFGGSPVTLYLYVEDVDKTAARAVLAGAKVVRPVADQFYGDRAGAVEDPAGHVWHIATHKEDLSPEELRKRAEAAMKAAGG